MVRFGNGWIRASLTETELKQSVQQLEGKRKVHCGSRNVHEPRIVTTDGSFVAEQVVAVTDSDSEIMSTTDYRNLETE